MRPNTEHKVNRTGWPPGPWDNEPDKLVWKTTAGLPGMVARSGSSGGLCGYVAVPPGHPLHGKKYDDAWDIEVHGGLTYANKCSGHICHEPEPGEPDDVWWFGFDCNHAWDLVPGMRSYLFGEDVYRDLAYVREQVESLATQLAARA